MKVDYNNIAAGFSKSRKNMKWEEIDYFLEKYLTDTEGKSVLDIGCGSARLLEQFSNKFDINKINYIGIDLSSEMINQAKINFPNQKFSVLSMTDLDKLSGNKYDFIFFIASYHHLDDFNDRLQVLEKVGELLNENGIIFMTNWALDSEINQKKYNKDIIDNSKNNFGSTDYNIYFGEYARYYHCFSLDELEYIFKQNNFQILENRLFETQKNIISIIKKNMDI
ncbi:MAG: class I SAM-dependent methyltransferase [Candidatus Gracilibacteria bacterium]|nr:class I SAM-dependent methyltransferase [Candidatus Gracilibacteria bacterium]